MPDVDGIDLLRFLRSNDAFAAVPVVSEFALLFLHPLHTSSRTFQAYCRVLLELASLITSDLVTSR